MKAIVDLDTDSIQDLKHSTNQMWEIGREDKAFAWVAEVLKRHSPQHDFNLKHYLEDNFDYHNATDLVVRLQDRLKQQSITLDLNHHNHEQNVADLSEIQETKDCLVAIDRDEYVAIYQGSPDTPDVDPIHPIRKNALFEFIDYVTGRSHTDYDDYDKE